MNGRAAVAAGAQTEPATAERVIVFWIPDWPVHAHHIEHAQSTESLRSVPRGATDAEARAPLALIAKRRVAACSVEARAEGVRLGLRESEAQARCPELRMHPHDPEVDERRFAPVLAALERLVPGVEPLRPGLCALRARGPARYYGGEDEAAEVILRLAEQSALPEARVGIADGRFAAEQAARALSTDPGIVSPRPGVHIVPPGTSPAFLSPLPVARAADPDFAEVLHGLGIRTLGALAALPEEAVRERFGPAGVSAHRRASAAGPRHGSELRPRPPAQELHAELALEPPLDSTEQLAFACMSLAERMLSGLTRDRLVCTALRVELTDDIGVRHERVWSHPRHFTAPDVVNRIRWQASAISAPSGAAGAPDGDGRESAGIAHVRLVPAHADRAAAHEPGLWSTEPDERVHHHLSRAQSRLGHSGVGTQELRGGRLLAERQRFAPWGTEAPRDSPSTAAGPWPGALPGPKPSSVFPQPIPARLSDAAGRPVHVADEDRLSADPARLGIDGTTLHAPALGWSRPWAIRERWWRGTPARFRLQLQLEDGDAWLLLYSGGEWFAEGHYD